MGAPLELEELLLLELEELPELEVEPLELELDPELEERVVLPLELELPPLEPVGLLARPVLPDELPPAGELALPELLLGEEVVEPPSAPPARAAVPQPERTTAIEATRMLARTEPSLPGLSKARRVPGKYAMVSWEGRARTTDFRGWMTVD